MTSQVVAIGCNQLWSLSPAIDLLDERVTGKRKTPDIKTDKAHATQTPASTTNKQASVQELFAKFGLSSSATRSTPSSSAAPPAAASTSSTQPSNPHALSALNVLVVEAGDILHVLKTMILQHRHVVKGKQPPPTHFYVLDGEPSASARHLLLLAIAFDTSLSLRGRTELFLEVYANALIQEKTQVYINRKVKEIQSLLASLSSLSAEPSPLLQSLYRGVLDISQLKSKDLDDIESALEFFSISIDRNQMKKKSEELKKQEAGKEEAEESPKPQSSDELVRNLAQKDPLGFDIETLRDHRLRGYFGDRYDARGNLIDWDYHMRLKGVASIIHSIHYKKWRMTGIAFEERLCTYNYANRTFASYREAKSKSRGSVSVRGFWADTIVSPYMSLGVEANEVRLFKRLNRQHVKTSPHVCEYNLLSLLYELETGSQYSLPKKKPEKKQSKQEQDEEIVELPEEVRLPSIEPTASSTSSSSSSSALVPITATSSSATTLSHTTPTALSFAHVKLFLLQGTPKTIATKARFQSLFDVVYISQFQVGSINEEVAAAAAEQVKKDRSSTDAPSSTSEGSNTPATTETPTPIAELPINKMLKNNAYITIETVKFLPVTTEIKNAYVNRVNDLAKSAGWKSAPISELAWSPDYFHSWSDREIEQEAEVEERKDANATPARVNFIYSSSK